MPKKKDDRLQLRMEPGLKDWFKQDAEPEGGMSRVVHQHVETRYAQKTGKPWKGGPDEPDAAPADGTDDGGAHDPP